MKRTFLLQALCAFAFFVASSYGQDTQNLRTRDPSIARDLRKRNKCEAIGSKICEEKGGFCTTNVKKCRKKKWTFVEKGCTELPSSSKKRCGCCIEPSLVDPNNIPTRKVISVMGSLDGGDPNFLNDEWAQHVSAMFVQEKDGSLLLQGISFVRSYANAIFAKVKGIQGETVSFEASPDQNIRCKPDTTCSFRVKGKVHSDNMDEIIEPERVRNKEDHHDAVFTSKQVEALAEFQMTFSTKLGEGKGRINSASWGTTERVDGLEMVSQANLMTSRTVILWTETRLSPLNPSNPLLELVVAPNFPWFEWRRNICVQPVRVRNRSCSFWIFGICINPTYSYSGAGLNFGRPGADFQWRKADVTFTWKPWVTIIDNSKGKKYETLDQSEMASLRAKVNNPNCIEVFFVKEFDPPATYGGGACWGSGTANAKIITSDGQVPCNVDKTHLAHELGHAIGLMHPGTNHATWEDGSTGTLMCPSGWKRDNPRRNSWENKSHIQNPLLVWYLAPFSWFPAPNCSNSAQCGSCISHIPSDSC